MPRSTAQRVTNANRVRSDYQPEANLGFPTTGSIRYVDGGISGAGTTSAFGVIPDVPFSTLTAGILLSTPSNGDVLHVMEGHTETIATAAGIDVNSTQGVGLSIIGHGRGSLKPTFTLSTLTTATFKVSAAGVLLRNLRFVSGVDSLVKFLDINASYCTIEDCDFITSSGAEALSFINLATTFDYLTVRRCRFEQPTDPTGSDGGADTGCLYCVDSEYILFEDCWFSGNFETAIFHNRTTACKHLWVKNCWGIQALSGAEPFQLVAEASGAMLGGGFITPAETGVTETSLVGTLGNRFFVLPPGTFGNDGDAGGQGGIVIATPS